jgi:hypothetical protein
MQALPEQEKPTPVKEVDGGGSNSLLLPITVSVHKISYEVIAEPPLNGAVHATLIAPEVPVFEESTTLVGALGTVVGIARPVTAVE